MKNFKLFILLLPLILFCFLTKISADELLNYNIIKLQLKKFSASVPEAQDLVKQAEDFLQQISYAEKIIILDKKSYWDNIEILRKALSVVDFNAVGKNDKEKFLSSLKNANEILKPIQDIMKSYILYLIGYSHIDLSWLWDRAEASSVWDKTARNALILMKNNSDFIFSQSQAAAYEWMERKENKYVFNKIKEMIAKGQWEIVGGTWVEPDSNLPSGESFVRQCLYGKRYFQEKFGIEVKIGWTPDSFGYNWNLPQIYKKCGLDGFLTQKISWNDTNKFPYNIFWWEAPDGTRLLTYFPPGTYNEEVIADRMLDQLKSAYNTHQTKQIAVIYGYGDHGGGPTIDMVNRAHSLQNINLYPTVKFSTAQSFFQQLDKFVEKNNIPVVKDELYLEYHRGTYTTQTKTKDNNRRGEVLLENIEKLSTLATDYGLKYPQEKVNSLWKILLFNQFHDILPGSSIKAVYEQSKKDFDIFFDYGESTLKESLAVLTKNINTQGKGKSIVVFNSLSFTRSDYVEIELKDDKNYAVESSDGKLIIPLQKTIIDKKNVGVFYAQDIPALGYKVYYLLEEPKINIEEPKVFSVTSEVIENKFFTIKINKDTGNITSIYDKQNNKEIVQTGKEANVLQFFEDYPNDYDAWNIGMGRFLESPSLEKVEVLEKGPQRAQISIKQKFRNSSFETTISVYRDLPVIDFDLTVYWKERKVITKLAFPLNLKNCFATFEIPYAAIERSTIPENNFEIAQWEQSAQKWVDYSEGTDTFLNLPSKNCSPTKIVYGVSLINRNKYGYDVKGNVVRITLLRGPMYPDMFADVGKHKIYYRLYPHKGNWQNAKTSNLAYSYNYPFLIKEEENHSGSLASENSFYSISPDNVLISVVKKAEDSDAVILRIVETAGKSTNANVNLPQSAKKVFETDLLERNLKEIPKQKNKISLTLKRFEIKTLKVEYK